MIYDKIYQKMTMTVLSIFGMVIAKLRSAIVIIRDKIIDEKTTGTNILELRAALQTGVDS